MNLFNKLPGFERSPPGLERGILREIPRAVVAGTLIPLLFYAFAWLYPSPEAGSSAEKYVVDAGIAAISVVLTVWTAALTVAIGCFIVVVMKGPAYVADAYPLQDADHPDATPAAHRGDRRQRPDGD